MVKEVVGFIPTQSISVNQSVYYTLLKLVCNINNNNNNNYSSNNNNNNNNNKANLYISLA